MSDWTELIPGPRTLAAARIRGLNTESMVTQNKQTFSRPHLWLIAIIGVIVPQRLRADWRQEWEAELRYRERLLAEWDRLDWRNKLELLRRSASAFWDAMVLQPQRLEDEMFQDLRYGFRMLLNNKMFTLVAALSLALGIGANTAIFSLINKLMLRMLPVKEPQELALFSVVGGKGGYTMSYPLYEMFRDQTQSFTGVICGSGARRARLMINEPGAGGEVETVQQERVSGNFFSTLGVGAVIGRTFTEEDDNWASAQPAAVISYEFWKRRFGLDPNVVGRKVIINDTALFIVGVAPPGFFGFEVGAKPDIWWPIRVLNDPMLSRASAGWLRLIGRLRPGVSVEQAQADANVIFRRSLANPGASKRGAGDISISLETGSAGYMSLRRQFRQPLMILMITVALVLLIACVNVANLLLARAAARRKEISVRLSVGASRFRLIRQLLTESVLLALIGGAAGLLFARLCASALLVYLPEQTRSALDVSLDGRALGFTLAISVMTGLLFGLAPALQATRVDLTASLKDQAGASAGRSRLALNKSLVIIQVALSVFLLIGAGLFVRSLRNLRNIDTGFDHENIVQFSIDPGSGYNLARRVSLYRQMLPRLETLPGALSATLSDFGLIGRFGRGNRVIVPGYTGPGENTSCSALRVGPGYFETMKMPILAGRAFGPQDERPTPPENQPTTNAPRNATSAPLLHAVISKTMARHFFGDENPVGKHFTEGGQEIEIVGVAKGDRFTSLREPAARVFYLYYFEQPDQSDMTFQLRASGGPIDYAATIHRLAREIDPQLQVINLRTMADVVNETLINERFIAQTAGAFSLFALLLACVGLYGVMSYAVTRRTNEIGIRMALGATVKDVTRLVMREVTLLVVLGVGIGITAAV